VTALPAAKVKEKVKINKEKKSKHYTKNRTTLASTRTTNCSKNVDFFFGKERETHSN
jgi:hypothetical protein